MAGDGRIGSCPSSSMATRAQGIVILRSAVRSTQQTVSKEQFEWLCGRTDVKVALARASSAWASWNNSAPEEKIATNTIRRQSRKTLEAVVKASLNVWQVRSAVLFLVFRGGW